MGCSVGGALDGMPPGSIMMLEDHMNMMKRNPSCGEFLECINSCPSLSSCSISLTLVIYIIIIIIVIVIIIIAIIILLIIELK